MGILDELRARRVIAVLRAPDPGRAGLAIDALVAGGVTAIEVTYSTPEAPFVIAEAVRRHPDAVIGAGTVTTRAQARDATTAGARYLVSPGTRADLTAAMLRTGLVVMTGALTPTEVMTAVELGAHVVKIFPASLGGPAFLKALRGPFPEVPLMPTGGVNADNVSEWFEAGALAVGAGSELCSTPDMLAGNWDRISANAGAITAAAAVNAS